MNLDFEYLRLLLDAVETKIRLLEARVNKTRNDEYRIAQFEYLKGRVQEALLEE